MRRVVSGSRMHPSRESSIAMQRRMRRDSLAWRILVIGCSCSVGYENVAFVAYGPDEARMLGIRLDLLAQPHDAQIHAAIERIPVPLLMQIEDRLSSEGPVRVLGERFKKVELQCSHRHFSAVFIGEPVC